MAGLSTAHDASITACIPDLETIVAEEIDLIADVGSAVVDGIDFVDAVAVVRLRYLDVVGGVRVLAGLA